MNIIFAFLSLLGALAFRDDPGPGFWIFVVIGIVNGIAFFCETLSGHIPNDD